MDYLWHYNRLIETRLNRRTTDYLLEKHHIIMKSMGGTDDIDNLVMLTPREHFIAHWLLWRIHRNRQTSFAFFSMCQFRKGDRKKLIFSSSAYEEAKISRKITGVSEETRKKMSLAKLGKTYTLEARKNMSNGKRGSIPWNFGKPATTESKQKMSASAQNRKRKHLDFFIDCYDNYNSLLSNQQQNILLLYIKGFTNTNICEKLNIVDYQIKNSLRSIKTRVLKNKQNAVSF